MARYYWIRKTHLFRRDSFVCSHCGAVCDKPHKACPVCNVPIWKVKYDPTWVDEAERTSALIDDDW